MIGHLRIKNPWSQLALFLGLFGVAFILTGLISILIYQANGVNPQKPDLTNPDVINTMKGVQATMSVVLFMLPPLLFAQFTFTGRYSYFLGFRKAQKSNMYILAVIGMLLSFPFVLWLGELNQVIPLPDYLNNLEEDASRQMTSFLKVENTRDVLVNLFIVAVLPAIGEELCFRGALQRVLIHISKNPWIGIILTAFLFSALHMQFKGFLPRMFLGVVLGAFYWYSASLWTSIIAHFIYNAAQVLLVSYNQDFATGNPELPVLYAIASGLVVWAIVWYYSRQSTVTWSKVYRTDDLTPTNQFLA